MGATLEGLTISSPDNDAFPGTPQELLTLLIDHLRIIGVDDVTGILLSQTEPSQEEANKIWAKTDLEGRVVSLNYFLGDWFELPLPPALLVRTANTILYWNSVGNMSDLSHPSTDPNPVTPAVFYFDENKALAVKQLSEGEAIRVGSGGVIETFTTTGIMQLVHLNTGAVQSLVQDSDIVATLSNIDLGNFSLDAAEVLHVDLSVQFGLTGNTYGQISLNLNGSPLITYNTGSDSPTSPRPHGLTVFHKNMPFVAGINTLTVTKSPATNNPYLHGAQVRIYRTI